MSVRKRREANTSTGTQSRARTFSRHSSVVVFDVPTITSRLSFKYELHSVLVVGEEVSVDASERVRVREREGEIHTCKALLRTPVVPSSAMWETA